MKPYLLNNHVKKFISDYIYLFVDSYFDVSKKSELLNLRNTFPNIQELIDFNITQIKIYFTSTSGDSINGPAVNIEIIDYRSFLFALEKAIVTGISFLKDSPRIELFQNIYSLYCEFGYNTKTILLKDLSLECLHKEFELGYNCYIFSKEGRVDNFPGWYGMVPVFHSYTELSFYNKFKEVENLERDPLLEISETLSFISFKESRKEFDTARFQIALKDSDISKDLIQKRLKLALRWINNVINNDSVCYEKRIAASLELPIPVKRKMNINDLLSFLANISKLRSDNYDIFLSEDIENFVLEYLFDKNMKCKESLNSFYAAKAIQYFYYIPGDDSINYTKLLGNYLLESQEDNGIYNENNKMFSPYLFSKNNSNVNEYIGTIIYSLLLVYNKTNEIKYLESAKKAFVYYSNNWQSNRNIQGLLDLFKAAIFLYNTDKEEKIYIFLKDILRYIDLYRIKESEFFDCIGGMTLFAKEKYPKILSSQYLECYILMCDLETKHSKTHSYNYNKIIIEMTRFLLQLQITEDSLFILRDIFNKSDIKDALGGFRYSILESEQLSVENSNAFCALSSVLKYSPA